MSPSFSSSHRNFAHSPLDSAGVQRGLRRKEDLDTSPPGAADRREGPRIGQPRGEVPLDLGLPGVAPPEVPELAAQGDHVPIPHHLRQERGRRDGRMVAVRLGDHRDSLRGEPRPGGEGIPELGDGPRPDRGIHHDPVRGEGGRDPQGCVSFEGGEVLLVHRCGRDDDRPRPDPRPRDRPHQSAPLPARDALGVARSHLP